MRHEALALFEGGIKRRYELDVLVGIDEAGRGALAGPVYAGACVMTDPHETAFINDSKLLSRRQRETAYGLLPAHALFATGSATAVEVDAHGILQATYAAMERALHALLPSVQARYGTAARLGVVVDGPLLPGFLRDRGELPGLAIIDADATILAVAGASIAAKVERDRLMCALAEKIRGYGFERNVGYGTQEHIDALRRLGPSRIHRHSFVVRRLLDPPPEELPFG